MITLEQVENFIDMLTGKETDGIFLSHALNLTRKQAFSVLYYLQEWLYIIPNHYEMCSECETLYDSENGGYTRQSDAATICQNCSSEYDFCQCCCELVPYGTKNDNSGECKKCQGE